MSDSCTHENDHIWFLNVQSCGGIKLASISALGEGLETNFEAQPSCQAAWHYVRVNVLMPSRGESNRYQKFKD